MVFLEKGSTLKVSRHVYLNHIRWLLELSAVSTSELATVAGISRQAMYNIRSGKTDIDDVRYRVVRSLQSFIDSDDDLRVRANYYSFKCSLSALKDELGKTEVFCYVRRGQAGKEVLTSVLKPPIRRVRFLKSIPGNIEVDWEILSEAELLKEIDLVLDGENLWV